MDFLLENIRLRELVAVVRENEDFFHDFVALQIKLKHNRLTAKYGNRFPEQDERWFQQVLTMLTLRPLTVSAGQTMSQLNQQLNLTS